VFLAERFDRRGIVLEAERAEGPLRELERLGDDLLGRRALQSAKLMGAALRRLTIYAWLWIRRLLATALTS